MELNKRYDHGHNFRLIRSTDEIKTEIRCFQYKIHNISSITSILFCIYFIFFLSQTLNISCNNCWLVGDWLNSIKMTNFNFNLATNQFKIISEKSFHIQIEVSLSTKCFLIKKIKSMDEQFGTKTGNSPIILLPKIDFVINHLKLEGCSIYEAELEYERREKNISYYENEMCQ